MSKRGKKHKHNIDPEIAMFYLIPYRKKGKKYRHALINLSKRIILRLGWNSRQELKVTIEDEKLILTPKA